jgi:hypothetical protein
VAGSIVAGSFYLLLMLVLLIFVFLFLYLYSLLAIKIKRKRKRKMMWCRNVLDFSCRAGNVCRSDAEARHQRNPA